MRLLLTGATGNVGTALLRRLSSEDDVEVVGLARRPPEQVTEPYDRVARWVAADVSRDDLAPALEGVDAVVHTAWLLQPAHDPQLLRRVNVDGTRRVVETALAAGVRTVVHLSSVAAYAPGPKDGSATEDHPHTGVPSSLYSRQKAEVEGYLDRVEAEHPDLRLVRVRPGVVFSRHAASSQVRYFLGPLVPAPLLRPGLLPVLPVPAEVSIQAVEAADLADALVRALRSDVSGGLNVATDPPVTGAVLADAVGSRHVDAPRRLVRALVDLTWRAHLQPTDAGWVDLGTRSPVMSTAKLRGLGWEPQTGTPEALRLALDAVRRGQGGRSPVLAPLASVPRRLVGALRGQPPKA